MQPSSPTNASASTQFDSKEQDPPHRLRGKEPRRMADPIKNAPLFQPIAGAVRSYPLMRLHSLCTEDAVMRIGGRRIAPFRNH
jgi:hypothetical protein